MSTNLERGFTIIETVLFLAITGALFAALMVGVSTNVTQQRYSDSVRSYKALLQDQFAAVLNTHNDTTSAYTCDTATKSVVSTSGPSSVPQGASDCVILGRAIQIIDDGQKIKTSSVIGYEPAGNDPATGIPYKDTIETADDITAIKLYGPKVADFDATSTPFDWGSFLMSMTTKGKRSTASILILRSPSSGSVKVFTSPNAITSPNTLGATDDYIDKSTATSAILVDCVDGDSGLLPKQLISVNPAISGADGVSTQDKDGSGSGDCSI
jgi:type II secretory pathway pseudopilin PulG